MTDASNTAVGAVLQQFVNDSWQPLGFYSSKLSDTQQKYSAYDRELLAIYMAIKHFRNQIEGRQLTIYTDHKPITYAFAKIGRDSETPRRTRQLLFISEFTTDIRHVFGEGNVVADALSRVDEITCPTTINFEELSAAQSDDATLIHLLQDSESSAKLKLIFLPSSQTSIVCDLTSKNAKPYYLPEKFQRFGHIHVDIVGPLPTTADYKYLLTIIDRCTGWPEAFPMKISADTVAKVELEGWIARYGCPLKLTSNQGKQFESNLFHKLIKLLGIDKIRTTPYHPQSNGMVERWHRSLKTALRARLNHKSWIEKLPIILLELRAVPRSDTNLVDGYLFVFKWFKGDQLPTSVSDLITQVPDTNSIYDEDESHHERHDSDDDE
ncbi:Transposon Tf2-9 polyprotein [Eumeta japonica]|uniref:Transposon Tf2-9 polyprotein n=1 Tax=Eumeta variegata TaxID=151549 RepID=A0A4C1YRP9_EUMVA|nr:Transposon Tf2-9 polyprotein [Eumeta japonica]